MAAVLESKVHNREIKRLQVWIADLGKGKGSEQGGIRPVVVTSNDKGNYYSPVVSVVPVTTKPKKTLPTHVKLNAIEFGLNEDSTLLFEQKKSIDKSRLMYKVAELPDYILPLIRKATLAESGFDV
ncbi:type II toxin-antitoxin system PemK/MazF family toxin [Paenibacillus sp. Marseille-Q4541]|uniref:type II toxin-antitoxin system PemK/MazF family toxin n=1 Tax=Paenibacillus sp. Marseille-Q4541 TaxID=2831522 RepID=UPI001BA9CC3C|nr:type II toxin-antitoxin system PemK/MazF family toxin [Paenibacillus sp. Marseille-Q4541]